MRTDGGGAAKAPKTGRIGYFLRMYPRFSQTFIVNEILELERQGVDLRILAQRKPDDGLFHDSVCRVQARAGYLPETLFAAIRKGAAAHVDCARAGRRAYFLAAWRWLTRPSVSLLELAQAVLLVRWARKNRVGHIHVHFGTGEATVALLARMMGGPSYSLTLHAFDIFRNNVDRQLLADKINHSRFTVTVCEANRQFMAAELPGIIADRIRVLYNGIDLERFVDAAMPRAPRTVVGVGRLIEKKGFHHLVQAVDVLRGRGVDVRVRIIGDGPDQGSLDALIEQRGLREQVRLIGPLRQEQVRAEMQRAACFVLPCQRAADGNIDALPTVLLEAMACACPVISTRIGGVREIIDHGSSGLLVEPENPRELAGAMQAVLTDDELAQRLARGGRAKVEQTFDVRRSVAQLRRWLTGDAPAVGPDVVPHTLQPVAAGGA